MNTLWEKIVKQKYLIVLLLGIGYIGYGLLGLTGVISDSKLPEMSQALQTASQGLDEISIDARMNAAEKSVAVTQTLKLKNRTGQTQDAAVLRTWANAYQSLETSPCAGEEKLFGAYYPDGFSSGALVMSRALVGEAGSVGQEAAYRYTDEAKTVLAIPVEGGWQADETLTLTLSYTLQIPHMANRFGEYDGFWALGNAFAIPAVWEDGAFRTDPYTPVGDPFVSDCANYTVNVVVPEGYMCAGTGYPTVETGNGLSSFRFSAPAVRDFGLVISNRFGVAQSDENGVLVTAYAADTAKAKDMLIYAQKALKLYGERYGAYPYQSYSLVQITFPHGGMEYPMMAMIGTDELAGDSRKLEYLIAHEAAHQWWYAVVGSDGFHQAWQDEALAEYSLLEYAEAVYGASERADLEETRVNSALRVTTSQGVAPGSPLSDFASTSEYTLLAYNRATAAICALDNTVPLDDFLRKYSSAYAFKRATRADFEALLQQVTGEDLAPLLRDYLDTQILN